ncbi:MAG: carboxypeptidase-like regulatory domain-containing protein [Candidatus Cloacimonetes bacterium]|nr:carboxypeptidase-like regulatory domain-containing protein [Candidatus Cloacimonadota bacterium]
MFKNVLLLLIGLMVLPLAAESEVKSMSLRVADPVSVGAGGAYLAGVIRVQDGQGIANAEVRLKQGDQQILETRSEAGGVYVFKKVPAGTYIITVLARDHVAAERIVNVKHSGLSLANLSLLAVRKTSRPVPQTPNWEIAPGSTFIERPVPVSGAFARPPMPEERW